MHEAEKMPQWRMDLCAGPFQVFASNCIRQDVDQLSFCHAIAAPKDRALQEVAQFKLKVL